MREMMLVFAVIILLVCETWSRDPGTSQSTALKSSTSAPKVYVVRNSSFNLGSDVNLTCNDKQWNELIFVIWQIKLKHKHCRIARNNDGKSEDLCNDTKSLRNTSISQPYLHIPNFSDDDVGVYSCETVYTGGADTYMIYVAITVSVPPSISAWLEWKGNKMVAVCKAERGKPAANISWSHTGNSSTLETLRVSDGFFTVESQLELPEHMDPKNLSCIIRHQYWELEKTLVPKLTKGLDFTLMFIFIVVIIIVLAVFIFFVQKKHTMLRQANTSESKSPSTEEVEVVEPYDSYVQRVNSIYNA